MLVDESKYPVHILIHLIQQLQFSPWMVLSHLFTQVGDVVMRQRDPLAHFFDIDREG